MYDQNERGLVLMFGRTMRRVLRPDILDSIVERGPGATEAVQIDVMLFPLYVIGIGDRRGYIASPEPPTADEVFLAARELFGNIGRAVVPEVHRVRRTQLEPAQGTVRSSDAQA
jgi:hypothetical protein